MGTGKTTFIRYLVHSLRSDILVNSPSFTIIQEYKLDNKTIVHVDLFRGVDKDMLKYLSECINDKNKIVLIEWAEKLPKDFVINNIIKLHFEYGENEEERFLSAEFFDRLPSSKEIKNITKEFQTPIHVQKHEKVVERVALALADSMIKNGFIIDRNLVSASSLLHDLVRVCNFPKIDNFDNFQEEITKEKIKTWKEQRQKYGNMHHADIAGEILRKKGFISVAQVIEKHKSKAIFEDFGSTEEEIVFIADKKVLHDKIVSIKERLADGRIRHNLGDEKKQKLLEEKIIVLAKQLFSMAGLKNEKELDNISSK